MRKIYGLAGALLGAVLLVTTANAATVFNFSFAVADDVNTVFDESTITGAGQFFSDTGGSPFLITNISGIAQGSAITGLGAVGTSYGAPDNLLWYPATLIPPTGFETVPTFLSGSGITFFTPGIAWNIGNFNGEFVANSVSNVGGIFNQTLYYLSNFTVTLQDDGAGQAVPLPAALPLFAGGLGLLSIVARRRRNRA